MPMIPTDMEALKKRTAKDKKLLKAKQERNEIRHQLTQDALEEAGKTAATMMGMDPGNVSVFVCTRGRRP